MSRTHRAPDALCTQRHAECCVCETKNIGYCGRHRAVEQSWPARRRDGAARLTRFAEWCTKQWDAHTTWAKLQRTSSERWRTWSKRRSTVPDRRATSPEPLSISCHAQTIWGDRRTTSPEPRSISGRERTIWGERRTTSPEPRSISGDEQTISWETQTILGKRQTTSNQLKLLTIGPLFGNGPRGTARARCLRILWRVPHSARAEEPSSWPEFGR